MTQGSEADVFVLDADECWALVRSASVGRLAVSTEDGPEIFPVNYAVDHGDVVFRTAEGTKLAALGVNDAVAFEVDGIEDARDDVWSVVIKGRAHRISRTDELVDTLSLPLFPWHAGRKGSFVRIVTEQITGRRFGKVDPGVWHTPLTDVARAPSE
jgi:nitroimidazol reductase NimA-like FMN-containing flavoprotein (pyridoxamine 5'-phosphate oxidase superfamily)